MAPSRPNALPRIALTLGDPAGISPEIVRAALLDERVVAALEPVVLGPSELRIPGCEVVESAEELQLAERKSGRSLWLDSSRGELGSFEMGRAQKNCCIYGPGGDRVVWFSQVIKLIQAADEEGL